MAVKTQNATMNTLDGDEADAKKWNAAEPGHACAVLRKPNFQYKVFFESNPIPMWVFDRRTLRFLAVNQAATQQYGYSEAEFLAMKITEIRPEETVPALLRDLEQHHRGLQSREQWRHRRKDGTIIDVEIVCHDVELESSEAMLVAAYDVTERERARTTRHARRKRSIVPSSTTR